MACGRRVLKRKRRKPRQPSSKRTEAFAKWFAQELQPSKVRMAWLKYKQQVCNLPTDSTYEVRLRITLESIQALMLASEAQHELIALEHFPHSAG